jgi:hypothetical protein
VHILDVFQNLILIKKDNILEVHSVPSSIKAMDSTLLGPLDEANHLLGPEDAANLCWVQYMKLITAAFMKWS